MGTLREANLESTIFSALLSHFSRMMSKYIKEKSLSTDSLTQTIKRVLERYPQERHLIKDLLLNFIQDLLLNSKQCLEILSDETMGEIFDKIPPKSIEWAFEMLFGDTESALIDSWLILEPADWDMLQHLQKIGFHINNNTIKRFANQLSLMVYLPDSETQCAIASWAVVTKNYDLLRTCLLHCCGDKLIFSPYVDSEIGTYTLTSLEAKPLEILKAVGTDVKDLSIHIDTQSKGWEGKDPWVKIAKACPHVETLALVIEGPVTPLDSRSLTQFSKLRYLELVPLVPEAWKAFCSLKIPATIKHICLEAIRKDQIEEISRYEFFNHLPPKITLGLDAPSQTSLWSYFSLVADPVAKLFHRLSHCTELRIFGTKDFLPPLKHLITYNQQLKSLFLSYLGVYPTVGDLQMLKNELPKLKKFHFKLLVFSNELTSKEYLKNDLRKFLKEWREQSKDNTEITWNILLR